jgi:hypothetical protein
MDRSLGLNLQQLSEPLHLRLDLAQWPSWPNANRSVLRPVYVSLAQPKTITFCDDFVTRIVQA